MSLNVKVLPSQHTFDLGIDETILQGAIRHGVGLPYGCQDGACGACKCRCVSGEVEMRAHQLKALPQHEREAGFILTCCATALGDLVLECPELPPEGFFPVKKMPCRIAALERVAPDVIRLRVQLPANESFKYHPGQYLQFLLRDGTKRAYSMAGAATQEQQLEFHIRHMPGGKFTDPLFGTMKEKDMLRLEGPFGSFGLVEASTRPMVLLASGTGLAPLKAIIEALAAQGNARPATLYWGCRKQSDLYLHDWLQQQAAALPWLRYVPVLSEPEAGWSGRTGLVHQAVMADLPDLSGHEVYACGVPIMVESAQRDFTSRCALPPDAFHADAFTSEKDKAGPAE
jgi:CDP-4-dehydro-6-deoxyglucose reductase